MTGRILLFLQGKETDSICALLLLLFCKFLFYRMFIYSYIIYIYIEGPGFNFLHQNRDIIHVEEFYIMFSA